MTQYIPYRSSNKEFARRQRTNPSYSEKCMRNILRKDQLGVRFLRQKSLGPYIVDFYCHELHLCVEVDGPHHQYTEEYDRKRDVYLVSLGMHMFRIDSGDIIADPDAVSKRIEKYIEELQILE